MNREQLVASATNHIRTGDGPNYDHRSMHYLAAIAKLLLAAELERDADASAGLCTVCARPRSECTCGIPRITDVSEWLPGDPT